MGRVLFWSCFASVFFSLLSATILANIEVLPVVPDLVLLVVLYVSFMNNATLGSSIGFFSGLLLDFLSAAPIGLNACTKAVTGYVTGKLSGKYNLDRFVIPFIMATAATVLKALVICILSLLFGESVVVFSLGEGLFWLELLFNGLSAPLVFGLLGLFPSLFLVRGYR